MGSVTDLPNQLTSSHELVEDKFFATLDPTSRRLRFPREREIILNDAVGFIHDLPGELVNAFRATLEEVIEADLLVHLVDLANYNLANYNSGRGSRLGGASVRTRRLSRPRPRNCGFAGGSGALRSASRRLGEP